jgi:ferrous iron transport protein B
MFKKVVIAGNPNAGKTTLYNALTHSHMRTGNWHGVTTNIAQKTVGGITYVDAPGMYSTNFFTVEERDAASALDGADLIINVVDATTLFSSLNLTRYLLSKYKKVVVYLTKVNLLKSKGGWVDVKKLQQYLGVPVYDIKPKSLKALIERGIVYHSVNCKCMQLVEAYYGGNCKITRCERLFYNKYFACTFFIFAIIFTFYITFSPNMIGCFLKEKLEYLLCFKFYKLCNKAITSDILKSFICDGLISGIGGVLAFIPQLALLQLCLITLDESGIMSALSFATDGIFKGVNLSGRAAFSLFCGLGCTAAAIQTTHSFSSSKAMRHTIAVLPYIPCGAKLPVFLCLLSPLFADAFLPICCLYFVGITLSLVISLLLGDSGEGLISEVTAISLPSFACVQNKLFFYVKGFIIKVIEIVAIFCALNWFLSHFSFTLNYVDIDDSMLSAICTLLLPLFYPMGIYNWRYVTAALSGFAAKENVAATINMLMGSSTLGLAPSVAFCVFMLTCPACIVAFTSSVKQIGVWTTIKYNILQLISAFLMAYLTYFIMSFI